MMAEEQGYASPSTQVRDSRYYPDGLRELLHDGSER